MAKSPKGRSNKVIGDLEVWAVLTDERPAKDPRKTSGGVCVVSMRWIKELCRHARTSCRFILRLHEVIVSGKRKAHEVKDCGQSKKA